MQYRPCSSYASLSYQSWFSTKAHICSCHFSSQLQASLVGCIADIEMLRAHAGTWILLIPLIHVLKYGSNGALQLRGDDFDKRKWWGVEDINSHVQKLKLTYPSV